MGNRTLDLEGLPEPIARGLEVVAEMSRKLFVLQKSEHGASTALELPHWPLGVIGTLTREEIYSR